MVVSAWSSVSLVASVIEDGVNESFLVFIGPVEVLLRVLISVEVLEFFLGWLVESVDFLGVWVVDVLFVEDGRAVSGIGLISSLIEVSCWLSDAVGLLWENFTESETVESELRNSSITLNDSLVTSSSFGRAVASLNFDNCAIFLNSFVLWLFLGWFLSLGLNLFFSMVVDVFFLFLSFLLLVKLIILWLVDRVTVDLLSWWSVELVRGEKLTETHVGVLLLDIDEVVLVLGDVWEERWEHVVDGLSRVWQWGREVDLGWSLVVKVIIPVPWSWLPDWCLFELELTDGDFLNNDWLRGVGWVGLCLHDIDCVGRGEKEGSGECFHTNK